MKILVNHLLEPSNRISGISKYLFSLLAELLKSGQHQYVLLTSWTEECLPAALRTPELSVVSVPYIGSTPRNLLRQLWLVPRIMKQHQADIEFNCNPLGGFTGAWPRVTVTHDLYFNVSPASYKWHHRLWWKLFYPLTCRAASSIICVSHNTRQDLLRYFPQFADKATVIAEGPCLNVPQGVDSDVQKRQNFGLFVANVSPNKGADTLVKALGLLHSCQRGIEVKHVGADSEGKFARLVAMIPDGVAPVSQGYLSDAELSNLYRQARFLAFPSRYEGFGLPVIEAQAHGTPVIASDIAVLREVAGDGAVFFPPEDASELARHMYALLHNDNLFSELSARALQNQQRFSWHKAARQTEQVFTQLGCASMAGQSQLN
ncbi:MAG TPA: glycosyltransferase family 1 protein [Rheinheimera sp.]|nr:glycosyltransferase family 1 protein [Rheinheimera sp.]